MRNIKNVLLIFLLLLLLLITIGGVAWIRNFENRKVTEDSDIILNQIRHVQKLITIEGYFTELYSHKDYYGFDIPLLRKKALVRVKAKASIGFDLAELHPWTDPKSKTLYIRQFPEPQVLSLDHSLDYYDITQGTFNYFTTADYNRINQNAKSFIEQKIAESELIDQAKKHSMQTLQTIESLVEGMGWTLQIEPAP